MAGDFTFTIAAEQLGKGLRPSKTAPRDSKFLVECMGAVGSETVLAALDSYSRISTGSITDAFPFPQLFIGTNVIIVCSATKIYEWNGSSLSLKYTAASPAGTWNIAESFDYIFLTNGSITVERNPESKVYELSTDQPHGTAVCNFNGQIIIGAPDVDGLGYNLLINADPIVITLTNIGTYS